MKGEQIEKFEKYSDNELIEIISENGINSNLAFSEIYKRYSKKLYAFCKHQSFDNDFSEIAFQEAWIGLYNNCISGKRIDNINAFLISVARRKIIDFFRKEKTSPSIIEFDEEILSQTNDTKNEMLDSVEILLEKGLEFLKNDSREAFILKRINNLEYKVISEITGFSIDCLKKRVSRAEDFLKKYIKENLEK